MGTRSKGKEEGNQDAFAESEEGSQVQFLPQIVGERVRARRLELGYSLEKVAQLSKVSRGMLGLIESGKSTASIQIFWKLALVLRSSFSDLVPDPFEHKLRINRKKDGTLVKFGKWNAKTLIPDIGGISSWEIFIPPGNHEPPPLAEKLSKQVLQILEGGLSLKVRGDTVELEEGDSIFFAGEIVSSFSNRFSKDTVVIWTRLSSTSK